MDCSPELAEWNTWTQRGVADPAETHTSAALRRGAFWRRLVLTSATPRAIRMSMYVCTTENNNVSKLQCVKERQQRVCAHLFSFLPLYLRHPRLNIAKIYLQFY